MTNLVERIAASMSSFGVKSTYGDVVRVGNSSVLPVAVSWVGFGGGGDGDDNGGAGGGAFAVPIGAYIEGQGGARFQPNSIALLAVSIPLAFVVGRTAYRLVRELAR